MTDRQALLKQIDAYLDAAPRKACDVEQSGPFTLFFRHDSPVPELSYARPSVPLPALEEGELDRVRTAFARGCRCVFLSAANETVQRVYARVGFAKIGVAMDTADATTH